MERIRYKTKCCVNKNNGSISENMVIDLVRLRYLQYLPKWGAANIKWTNDWRWKMFDTLRKRSLVLANTKIRITSDLSGNMDCTSLELCKRYVQCRLIKRPWTMNSFDIRWSTFRLAVKITHQECGRKIVDAGPNSSLCSYAQQLPWLFIMFLWLQFFVPPPAAAEKEAFCSCSSNSQSYAEYFKIVECKDAQSKKEETERTYCPVAEGSVPGYSDSKCNSVIVMYNPIHYLSACSLGWS